MRTAAFIGTGTMGGALARAACRALSPAEVILANRTPEKADALARELGCVAALSNEAAVRSAQYIFLCVKPQLFAPLARLAESDHAGIVPLAQNGLQQGTFSGAVWTDEGGELSAVDMELRVFQDFVVSDCYGQFFHPQAAGLSAVPVMGKLFHPRASFTVSMLRYIASK